mmetsp:Transcript_23922/g.35011  ORF Transcript_23922/g.35011 Transcript_23922/m.35011 type:complete len:138 (-) Transcript_23922:127-540(-)
MMMQFIVLVLFFFCTSSSSDAFISSCRVLKAPTVGSKRAVVSIHMTSDSSTEGIVELADDEEDAQSDQNIDSPARAIFISQSNEIAEDVLSPNLSDPKQTRVILYIIISLVPVLFLVPLMLGSRDLIPLDTIPPVDL